METYKFNAMKKLILTASILVLLVSCSRTQVSLEALLNEITDHETIARFPDPVFSLKQFSSYDRATTTPDDSTWFANWDRSMFIRTEENQGRNEYVLFDAQGPGAVVRFWMTFAGENSGRGIMRIYFDGSQTPEIEGTAFEILSGAYLTGFPLAASVSEETPYENRGHNLYLPLPYAKSCKITYESENIKDAGAKTGGEAVYYNINYRTYPSGTATETFSMAKLRELEPQVNKTLDKLANFIRQPESSMEILNSARSIIEPGKSISIPLTGANAIRRISVRTDGALQSQLYRSLVIEMEFDGLQTVWCPLGDFFGTGYQLRPSDTWYTSVKENGTLECYWVMPFSQEATVRIHNLGYEDSPEITLDVIHSPWEWNQRSMHFGSSWHQYTHLHTGGRKNNEGGGGSFDMNYVTLTGKGVYAGDAITLFNTKYDWWGEGDEKVFVDGEDFPSHIGTGTEDYYGYAWCRPEKFTNHPFIAQPDGSGNFWPGYTVNIRHRGLDGIPFQSSLQFDMEMWHWAKAVINFAPVTYWYMLPGGKTNILPDHEGIQANVATRRTDIVPAVIKDNRMEGEDLAIINVSGGIIRIQDSDRWGWSENSQLWWTGGKQGDQLTLAFESEEAMNAHVTARFTVAPDYGSVRLNINGKLVSGTFNLHHPEVSTREIYLGRMPIAEGRNQVTVSLAGTSPQAGRAYFGLDVLKFSR